MALISKSNHQSEANHISNASQNIRTLYQRYRDAVLNFGNDITIKPTQKYVSFRVNEKRFANSWIHPGHFKIWLDIKQRSMNDPRRLATPTDAGHTLIVSDDQHREYIIGLVKQAYERNK
jgi:predicted transport protein